MGLSVISIQEKIANLTPEQLAAVEALISRLQDEEYSKQTSRLSEPAFAAVWNHSENDEYDSL